MIRDADRWPRWRSAAGQAVAAQSAQLIEQPGDVEASVLHLRGLDTLNGAAQDIDMRVGETTRFGHLEITAETCRVPRDDPAGDAYAFLRIRDVREDGAAVLGLDVRLVAGALGARPPALRRLGAELQQRLTRGVAGSARKRAGRFTAASSRR